MCSMSKGSHNTGSGGEIISMVVGEVYTIRDDVVDVGSDVVLAVLERRSKNPRTDYEGSLKCSGREKRLE